MYGGEGAQAGLGGPVAASYGLRRGLGLSMVPGRPYFWPRAAANAFRASGGRAASRRARSSTSGGRSTGAAAGAAGPESAESAPLSALPAGAPFCKSLSAQPVTAAGSTPLERTTILQRRSQIAAGVLLSGIVGREVLLQRSRRTQRTAKVEYAGCDKIVASPCCHRGDATTCRAAGSPRRVIGPPVYSRPVSQPGPRFIPSGRRPVSSSR